MIDGVMQSLELIYTWKFQKAGMSILGDAKSYYVKDSSVNSVIIYIFGIFGFSFTKNNYLQPLIFRQQSVRGGTAFVILIDQLHAQLSYPNCPL